MVFDANKTDRQIDDRFYFVPLEGVSWNQLTEELKGWLELRDILATPV